ncbi:MAG: LPS export ABC transporter periplasmic protein LptC [Campylobacterota bacterium]|nr:LPS export ABC transporter periplasmic protein LptC [Campylobacterota bacterium]
MGIFLFFKPMNIKNNHHGEIANFEVYSFVIHELDTKGLTTVLQGSKAFMYKDRYVINDVDYKDSSRKYISNIKAKTGTYKDKVIDLVGDVVYTREDGLVFKSKSFKYDEKTGIARTNDDYIMYDKENEVIGKSLSVDNNLNKIYSKNIVAKYQIREK